MSRKDELYHYGVKGMKWGKRKDYLKAKAALKRKQAQKIHADQERASTARQLVDRRNKYAQKREERNRKASEMSDYNMRRAYENQSKIRARKHNGYAMEWDPLADKKNPKYGDAVRRNFETREEYRNRMRSKGSTLSGEKTARSYMKEAKRNAGVVKKFLKTGKAERYTKERDDYLGAPWKRNYDNDTGYNAKQLAPNLAKAGKAAAKSFIRRLRKKRK